MFITNQANRATIPTAFGANGEEFWKTVELALHCCWYLLSVRQRDLDDPEHVIGRTILLGDYLQLEQVLDWGSTAEFWIEAAQIVSPAHINGGDTWEMDRLTKVWSATEPDKSGQSVAIFETRSGKIYTDSWIRTPHEKLLDKKLKFELPR